jgi:hypothetical protein
MVFVDALQAGDDLRQDYLTLQLITIMDRLWQDNGLNMCMKPYKCVPTGDEKGMLQVSRPRLRLRLPSVQHIMPLTALSATYNAVNGPQCNI